MSWVAICERLRPGMGRNENKTYINVVTNIRQLSFANAQAFVDANPNHPWADPAFNEFIVDLTDQEAIDIRDGVNPLFHDGTRNNPRWQQETASSGTTIAAKSFGSWADPRVAANWVLGTVIADDRWIVRVYDVNPVLNPGSAVHLASEEFDEGVLGSSALRFIRLFTPSDNPSGTNAQNSRVEIGGKLIDFDFTSGVAEIRFATDVAGFGAWNSNHRYRIIGPGGEKDYKWQVFGKVLKISRG